MAMEKWARSEVREHERERAGMELSQGGCFRSSRLVEKDKEFGYRLCWT